MRFEHEIQTTLHVLDIFIASVIQDLFRERTELRPELSVMPEMLQPGRHHGCQSVQFRIQLRTRFHVAARGQLASTLCTLPSSTRTKRNPACSTPSSCSVAVPASRCVTEMT